MIKSLPSYWLLASRRRVIAVGVLTLALLGYVDWSTGPAVLWTCFYAIPAYLFGWFLGRRMGYLVAFVHALIWFAIDVSAGVPIDSPFLYWNMVVRFVTVAVIVWIVHVCRDLTREIGELVEAKTAGLRREVALRRESEEAIHRLASQLSAAEDAERRRLGQDVHDALGQNLSLLKLRLEAIAADLPPDSSARRRLAESAALLDDVIQQSRTLTFELYPSMLDDLGAGPTLRHYAEQLARQTAVAISVAESDVPPPALPAALRRLPLPRGKELITNAIKHGPARFVLVQLRWRDGGVRLIVDDDGKGFDADGALKPDGHAGLGLAWIAERVRSFGGVVHIESAPSEGARVVVDLPCAHSASLRGARICPQYCWLKTTPSSAAASVPCWNVPAG